MPALDSSELARWLSDAARDLSAAGDMQQALDESCRLAVAVVAGCRSAAISEGQRDERGAILAASDDIARELHAVQYELHDGPGTDAIWQQRVVWCNDFKDERRWPRFAPEALNRGIRSCTTIQLYTHAKVHAHLALYSDVPGAFDEVTRDVAQIFASQAASVLTRVRTNAELSRALTTRQRIGQATGILAERHGLTTSEAFARLVRTSQEHNIRLRDIADQFVTSEDDNRHAPG